MDSILSPLIYRRNSKSSRGYSEGEAEFCAIPQLTSFIVAGVEPHDKDKRTTTDGAH